MPTIAMNKCIFTFEKSINTIKNIDSIKKNHILRQKKSRTGKILSVRERFFMHLFRHFFLLYLVVDDMTGGELLFDFVHRNPHLRHQHEYVIG